MARVLRNTVITGGVTYPAGTAETAKLAKAITNPRAWEGEPDPEPAPVPRKRAATKATSASKASGGKEQKAPADEKAAETPEEPEEPPRGGEGATEEAWRAYAAQLDLEVPEDAGRDDIIALVDARNS